MRGSRWFIIGIVLFLLIMFVVEYHLPKKFVWNPTFGQHDHQPLGGAVFDDVLKSSLPDGYSLSRKTFYQFAADSSPRKSILVVTQHLDLVKADVSALLDLARRGNKILIASSSFSPLLADTLGFNNSYAYFNPRRLKEYAADLLERDSVFWIGDSAVYDKRTFRFYPHLCGIYFTKYDSLSLPLATSRIDSMQMFNDSLPDCFPPVAISRPFGRGEIVLVTTPLLFTNYGMLDGDNAAYLFRLLSHLKGLPVIRTEAYGAGAQIEESPFRYFLSQRPLKWALYLTMSVLVLFMVFTARRRQRPIPVIREQANRNLEFTELIGILYYQKKNHADLVRKKFTYFAESLRRNIQVDVEDDGNDDVLCSRIARKTGNEEVKVRNLFRKLRPVVRGEQEAGETLMKDLIDGMNEIEKPRS